MDFDLSSLLLPFPSFSDVGKYAEFIGGPETPLYFMYSRSGFSKILDYDPIHGKYLLRCWNVSGRGSSLCWLHVADCNVCFNKIRK